MNSHPFPPFIRQSSIERTIVLELECGEWETRFNLLEEGHDE
jgi:hypothetical protein